MPRKPQPGAAEPGSQAPFPAPPRDDSKANGQFEAIAHLKAGRLAEATALFERVIAENPENWQSIHLLGLVAYKQGLLQRAAQLIRQCLTINPTLAEGYSDLSVILKDIGDLDDAQAACERALALKPDFHPAYSNLGNIMKAFGKLQDAAECYQRAIEISPNFADGYANLGSVLLLQGKTEEALDSCLRAVEIAPSSVDALIGFSHALRAAGEFDDAIAICRRAIELRPDYGPPYSDLGCVLQEAGRYDEAIRAHRKALELAPNYAQAHNNLGIAFKDLGRYREALESYNAALSLKPDYTDAYSNMGVVLGLLGQNKDAVGAYRRALELDPRLLVAYINLAAALSEQDLLSDAIATYAKALTIDPDNPAALVDHYHLRREACDWDGLAAAEQRILSSTYRRGKRVPSFPILNIPCDAEDHLLSAREWSKGLSRPIATPFTYRPPRSAAAQNRLRIGYVSADFYSHATTNLMAELVERHDRRRFEVFGYCFSPNDASAMRRRITAAFDQFVPISQMPHAEAAERINRDGVDILIDLKGYTTHARTEIFACRPAPIQVNYLGYPGTMGADFIDYIVADEFTAPMDQQPFFDENIVHLPGCYQPNDTKRSVAADCPSRRDCGLPERGFVFCSFNSSYKITPEMFGLWMRLLNDVSGSVLWLLESNSLMRENLRRKAVSLGVDPARLVFAPKMELSVHLARHRHADLFLDSLPVNAHTTASDALWAGLPMLTCAGETFVSRVCGSLLKAVGLTELITYSLDQYERTALGLARNPDTLAQIRAQLARTRMNAPLFDIETYTKGLEAAYEHMSELREKGKEPRAFSVNDIGGEEWEILDELTPAGAAVAITPEPVITTTPVSLAALEAYTAREFATAPAAPPQRPAAAPQDRIPYDACPLCDSPDFPVVKPADSTPQPNPALPAPAAWCRCNACGHVFTQSHLAPEASERLWAKLPPQDAAGYNVEPQRLVSARIVGQIAKLKPGGDWLDVDFGSGSMLFTAEEWGYRPVGIDPRGDNAETLKRLGYEVPSAPARRSGHAGPVQRRFHERRAATRALSERRARCRQTPAAIGRHPVLLDAEHGDDRLAHSRRERHQSVLERGHPLPQFHARPPLQAARRERLPADLLQCQRARPGVDGCDRDEGIRAGLGHRPGIPVRCGGRLRRRLRRRGWSGRP